MNNSNPKKQQKRQQASHQFKEALDHLHGLTTPEILHPQSFPESPHCNRVDWEDVGEELDQIVELGEDF